MNEADKNSAYECVGVCTADPESGLCTGCGYPFFQPAPADQAGASEEFSRPPSESVHPVVHNAV